jgi:nitroreductase
VELSEAVRRRRMVRSFSDGPLDPDLVTGLLADALSAPTAGNTRGVDWAVLEGHDQTAAYWAHTTTEEWRQTSSRWPGLSRAPVVALALTSPSAYVDRYGASDKATSGLGPIDGGGGGPAAWPVPYWYGDAAFSTMTLLLAASAAGIGACFLGNFRGEAPLLEALGVPAGRRLFGAVLLGHPDGSDHRSGSLDRPGPSVAERLHRGRW